MGYRHQGPRDEELVNMVGNYLVTHANLNYVDLQDMVDSIQASSYRYSRMKKQIFQGMVRRAYQLYCDTNNLINEHQGGAVENANVSSDSDVEIEEQPTSSVVMKNQITNLYLSPAPNSAEAAPARPPFRPSNVPPPPPRLSVSPPRPNAGNTPNSGVSSISSDDELEIIEEVNNKPVENGRSKSPTLLNNTEKPKSTSSTQSARTAPVVQTLKPIIKNISKEAETARRIVDKFDSDSPPFPGLKKIPVTSAERTKVTTLTPKQQDLSSFDYADLEKREGKRGTKRKLNTFEDETLRTPGSARKKQTFTANTDSKRNSSLENLVKTAKGQGDTTRSKNQRKQVVVRESSVTFSDFGGNDKIIEEICKLLLHLKHPEIYRGLGVVPPRGFLLHGAPGCGKTLLANAIAGELKMPLIKIAATELITGISGESEQNIRELFQQAVDIAPCILFIDEIDAITPKRENASKEMEKRIVSQLLICIDELATKEKGDQVLLIGATNRVETIDTALRRAGRFDREICLGIPDTKAREQILRVMCRDLRLSTCFDFKELAKLTPGYVGADLQALLREAAVQSVDKILTAQQIEADLNTNEVVLPNIDKEMLSNPCKTKEIEKPEGVNLELPQSNDKIDETIISENLRVDATEEPIVEEPKEKSQGENCEGQENMEAEKPQQTSEEETQKIVENLIDTTEKATEDSLQTDNNKLNESVIPNESNDISILEGANVQVEPIPGSPQPMEVDTATIDSIAPEPGSKLSSSNPVKAEKNFLKWIRDTCPLTEEALDNLYLQMEDFVNALKYVQPSSKREGFATVPDITWDDIGALKEIREELQVSILGPVKHSSAFQSLGLNSPAGVLLCGPPGCGKTLLAKAVANEAGINFISVKGPELLNMYVGESERAVRQCFLRAKNSSPCVIFFDELDALCPRRSDGFESGASRVVNQLLTEMDGMESRIGVFVMAATNRPDIIDPAILRPGRLDKIIFVNLPTPEDRLDILKAITKNGTIPRLADDVNLEEIASSPKLNGFTGADLSAIIREASVAAFRELVLEVERKGGNACEDKDLKVHDRHLKIAIVKTKPSVTKEDLKKYHDMGERYSSVLV